MTKYYLMGSNKIQGPWEAVYVFDQYPKDEEVSLFTSHQYLKVQKVWEWPF